MIVLQSMGDSWKKVFVGAVLCTLAPWAVGAPPTPRPERSLLGVPLLAPYTVVLRRLGQPSEVQVGIPYLSAQAFPPSQQSGNNAGPSGYSGAPTLPGLPGTSGPTSSPYSPAGGRPPYGMPGSPYGMPGSPYGMPGSSSSPYGMPGMPPGVPAEGSVPYGGIPAAEGKRGSRPNFAGGSSFPGAVPYGSSMPGYPGMSGATLPGTPNQTVQEEGLTTWWYHFPELGLHYSFLFNKQGRVIQIQAYGYKPSPKVPEPISAEGITLGSPLSAIIRHYGWSSDGESSGDYIVLRYGGRDQIAFQLRHNHVVGIVLGLAKP